MNLGPYLFPLAWVSEQRDQRRARLVDLNTIQVDHTYIHASPMFSMSATCCRNFAIHRNYPFSFRPPDHVGISCFEGRQAEAMIAKDARSTELSSAEGSGTPLSAGRRGTGCALADRRPFDRSTAFLARRTWVSTGSAQVQNFANAFPSRREGRIFLRPRYVSLAWSQAADQYPDLSNGVRAAASSTYTIPTLNHISPWASPCRPRSLPPLMG